MEAGLRMYRAWKLAGRLKDDPRNKLTPLF